VPRLTHHSGWVSERLNLILNPQLKSMSEWPSRVSRLWDPFSDYWVSEPHSVIVVTETDWLTERLTHFTQCQGGCVCARARWSSADWHWQWQRGEIKIIGLIVIDQMWYEIENRLHLHLLTSHLHLQLHLVTYSYRPKTRWSFLCVHLCRLLIICVVLGLLCFS